MAAESTTQSHATTLLEILENYLPAQDKSALTGQHGIKDFSTLLAKKEQLQNNELANVCNESQDILAVICDYINTLEETAAFSIAGFENYCDPNRVCDDDDGPEYNEESVQQAKMKAGAAGGDPEGYNLTTEERNQISQAMEDDPLTIKIRGFSSASSQFEFDEVEKRKEDESEKTSVVFNGNVYFVKKCYTYKQPKSGETVVVGILKFTRNEKKAICTLVVPFHETVMGPRLVEEPPIGVSATYEEDQSGVPPYVQVRAKPGTEPIVPLSALTSCQEPLDLTELIFERQQDGQSPHNFGFVYENDGSNRGEERKDFPFLDLFAGAGGLYQGFMQVPGFKCVAAVECWDTACETFKKNNPETPIHCEKVEDYLKEDPKSNDGPRPKIVVCTPPCESFSGANRDVDHNGELDLYRKRLSLTFVDSMQAKDALAGVFENVEGMWRRPNIYFLKKIVLDLIRSSHQVRVRLHYANVFGDPQARPRLLIFATKKFVPMINVIETHGPGKLPFVTVGNALKALEEARASPEMHRIPNLEGSSLSKPDKEEDILMADQPARTIRGGGRAWHPTEDRCINVREAAQLQSYPPTYEFFGNLTDQYKQVGNSVPGQMAKAVARAIWESLRFVFDEEMYEIDNTVSMKDEEEQVAQESGE